MLLDNSANIILSQCMMLKPYESCLIVTDSKLKKIGMAIFESSKKISQKSKIVFTNIPQAHGQEPLKNVADEMLKHDVILLATTKSLSHTKARKEANKKGARIASMPGITIEMMERALDIDYSRIKGLNEKLQSILENKKDIKITTKKGTDITFYVKGRKWIDDGGNYSKKGAFGNLPAGEVFVAPLESKTNGTIIVDASIGGIGETDKDVKITIKDGFISHLEGGKIGMEFKKLLKDKLYRNVAELGIGTNYKAEITGNVLEDEKVLGTCHIAFGNNRNFGGKIDVPFHVDVVVKNPSIYADNIMIMENGRIT